MRSLQTVFSNDRRGIPIAALPFREEFKTALYDLYLSATPSQRAVVRQRHQAGAIESQKPWRNPSDYDRSDLTRRQRVREQLIAMSIRDGGADYRDDLMSIAYCYHNLLLLGDDADAVLLEVAEISGPGFTELLREFVTRTPESKSQEAFALRIERRPDGPAVCF